MKIIMMNQFLNVVFLLLIGSSTSAQKEDYQWTYNLARLFDTITYPTWGPSVLDFNTLPPTIYANWDIKLDIKEAHASICDEEGQMLFYSNAQSIHGPNHQPISNGDTINFSRVWRNFTWDDENGIEQPNGLRGVQTVGFIPQPETDTVLVLYHDSSDYMLRMSKIKIDDNGHHSVVIKDEMIDNQSFNRGQLSACKHANGRDWWLLQFSRDTVRLYLIDPSGLQLHHTQILPFTMMDFSVGQYKFSPDGSKIVMHVLHSLGDDLGMDFFFSGFDRCTGSLIDPQLKKTPSHDNFLDNGVEFSSDSRLVYIGKCEAIEQYDTEAEDFFGSRIVVAEHNQFNNCSVDIGPFINCFGQMQQAPDNKIYISLAEQCNDIHVIDFPNVRGPDCQVRQNAIYIPTFAMGTIPNFNTLRLGPLDGSPCDTLDLNNEPVSRFWYEQDSVDFLSLQFWDVSYYRPESWRWAFGDGTISFEQHPTHTYAENGAYNVCLTVSNENSSNTSCQTLYLGVSSTLETEHKADISLFPNPTEGRTRLLISDYLPQEAQVLVYSISGDLVYSQKVKGGANGLDLSGLASGTYVYEVRDGGVFMGGGKVVLL